MFHLTKDKLFGVRFSSLSIEMQTKYNKKAHQVCKHVRK